MITEGVASEDQMLMAGDIHEINTHVKGEHWYEIVLYEGKQRQVRRMFEALGYQVIRLKRTQFASVKLDLLPLGAVRSLTEKEISALLAAGWH
jgi:23S rRNA pseudouridine2605 synthase